MQNGDIFLRISFDVLSKLITEFRGSSYEKIFFSLVARAICTDWNGN